jgi:3-dehydroquinate synthase II
MLNLCMNLSIRIISLDKFEMTLLQNAETIKLVGADGKPMPVTALKEGDEVMVYFEAAARHFGIKIEETIIEK